MRGQPRRRAVPVHHVGELVVAVHQAGDEVERLVRAQPVGGDVEAGQISRPLIRSKKPVQRSTWRSWKPSGRPRSCRPLAFQSTFDSSAMPSASW